MVMNQRRALLIGKQGGFNRLNSGRRLVRLLPARFS
jgi:hypothetical protein